jgi:hypothetical protein
MQARKDEDHYDKGDLDLKNMPKVGVVEITKANPIMPGEKDSSDNQSRK